MVKKINHIGIVVRKIDDLLPVLERAFGARELRRKEIPDQKQISSMVQLGDGYLELMEPISQDGATGRFLEQKGEGIHHISVLCESVPKMVEKLEGLGLRIIGQQLESEEQIAFIHPKTLHGILLEITNTDSAREGS